MTRVRALRIQKGLTVDTVSFLSAPDGIDKATVSRIERLEVRPRRATVVRLARGLDVPPRRLWALLEADWADKVLAEHDAREPVS